MHAVKNKKINAAGAVLAGGKSQRMGTDKALVKVGEYEIIKSVALEMQKIVSQTFIVCSPGQERRLPVGTEINDIYAGCGPLGGIHSALVHSDYKYCLVAACDMPFFDADIGRYLLERAEGYDAVVPVIGALPEPLLAVYSKKCIKFAEQKLAKKEYKITSMYADLKINYIDEKSLRDVGDVEKVFFNVNSPRDLKKANIMKKICGKIPVVAVVGWSNSGKTTLLEKLIPELKSLGIRVAVVKHHGKPGLELDKPGKDTWRFARAGASVVVLAAHGGLATYNYTFEDPALEDALCQIEDVDIIFVEGYKNAKTKKIEVIGEIWEPVVPEKDLVAVVADKKGNNKSSGIPYFSRDDVKGLAGFVVDKYLKNRQGRFNHND